MNLFDQGGQHFNFSKFPNLLSKFPLTLIYFRVARELQSQGKFSRKVREFWKVEVLAILVLVHSQASIDVAKPVSRFLLVKTLPCIMPWISPFYDISQIRSFVTSVLVSGCELFLFLKVAVQCRLHGVTFRSCGNSSILILMGA